MPANKDLNENILTACKEAVKGKEIVSICIYGSQVCGYAREDSDYDILLVLEGYREGVRYYYRMVDDKQFAILTVDQAALELDAEKGDLGDFVAGRFLSPYIPVLNPEYLGRIEFTVKRRFAEEDLEDLIIEYGELSRGLVIRPEYLVLARMEKRSRIYPPLKYSYINMLREGLRAVNMRIILDGYERVFANLAASGMVEIEGKSLVLVDSYVDKVLSYKILNRVVNLMDFSKKAFYSYITHGKAGKVRLEVAAKELASKIKREIQTTFNGQELEDPKNYLYLKTEQGLINLNKKDAIIEKIRMVRGNKEVNVRPLSGALNEVFLVTIDDKKFVAKKFTDWYNLKWFVLNIVAYGTKIFHLSGKARLSNEYVTNQLLAEKGIPVPEIVSISLEDRMLVERYIRGQSILETVLSAVKSDCLTSEQRKCAFEVGRLLALIHGLNITMGDCKPENFIAGEDGKVYVLDLEQGERHGDKVWDVAEFLYFSGHFGATLTTGLQQFVREFVAGYSSVGEKKVLRNAAELRYTKVFFPWTPMPVIQGISTILKTSCS